MIIPVRCFGCGALISDKWVRYNELCRMYRSENGQTDFVLLDADILNKKKKEEVTAEARALKELKVNRMCCRTHFLCNVDMIDII